MSIDPSSIPSFGGQPKKPAAKKPLGPIKPDQNLVKQLLEQMKLKFVVDKEGDLVAPWENFRIYFMFRGKDNQRIFSVRTFYDRKHDIEDKPQLLETINDWNRRTLWPKMYTHTHDDGTVRLIGEIQMLVGTGVALDHYVTSTVSWIRASIEFDKWLVQELGLAKDVDGGGSSAGGDTNATPADGENGAGSVSAGSASDVTKDTAGDTAGDGGQGAAAGEQTGGEQADAESPVEGDEPRGGSGDSGRNSS